MVDMVRRILALNLCVIIMAALIGCAVPSPKVDTGNAQYSAGEGDVYSPKVRSGTETFDAARRDMADLLRNRTRPVGVKYHGNQDRYKFPDTGAMVDFLEAHDLEVLDFGNEGNFAKYKSRNVAGAKYLFLPLAGKGHTNYHLRHILKMNIPVLDDRIDVPLADCYYEDLVDWQIAVMKTMVDTKSREMKPYVYSINLQDRISFLFHERDLADAQRLADDLFCVQQSVKKRSEERQALFQSRAAQYRTLAIKPPVSEEQRKLIVQANVLNEQKDYAGAVRLYLQAVDLDPVAYPGAYFNLALLSAQVKRYNPAISYMKQYLLLEPDAPDARSAQDKVYEWELMGKK